MKTISKIIFSTFLFIIVTNSSAQFVTIKGKQFYDENGNPFFPVIINYGATITYNTYPPTSPSHLDINPHPHQGNTIWFENSDGTQALNYDFQEMYALGFNTVRLGLGLRRYNSPLPSYPCASNISGPLYTIDWFIHSWDIDNNINAGQNKCFAIQPPYSSDINVNTNMSLYLQKLNEVITLAGQAGLKVILLAADGFELFNGTTNIGGTITNQDAVNDYQDFLQVLTTYFANNNIIMAYDLDNEPHYKDGDHGIYNRPKEEVCTFITQLYDAIKQPTVDPNHLITIGLGDPGTIMSWDAEVMKTDFACLHLYPYPQLNYDFTINNQTITMQHAIDRLNDQIYWASNYLQRPWVLEETGFNSTPPYNGTNDWNWQGVYGNYAELNSFVTNLLPVIKNCGASGLAWWNFQDGFQSLTSPGISTPTTNASNDYREQCWGMVKAGNPIAGNYATAGLEKLPQPTPFETFNWNGAQSPCSIAPPASYSTTSHYYDPFLNKIYNTAETGFIEGNLIDNQGNPVKGAVVMGRCWLRTRPDPNNTGSSLYDSYGASSFSDETGYYKVIPFNYDAFNFGLNRITLIRVMAPGTKVYDTGNWDETQLTPSTHNFTMDRVNMNYDESLTASVSIGSTKEFKGWNSLTLTGTINGNSDITARQEINLETEFHASSSSEVHIYPADAFPDCFTYTGYRTANPLTNNDSNNDEVVAKEISLSFLMSDKKFAMLVFPVPNKGIFTIRLLNEMEGNTSIKIKDLAGAIILQLNTSLITLSVNQTALAKGAYFIEATNNNQITSGKLIIQ
jgi:hypothetical protein